MATVSDRSTNRPESSTAAVHSSLDEMFAQFSFPSEAVPSVESQRAVVPLAEKRQEHRAPVGYQPMPRVYDQTEEDGPD